MKDLVQYKKCGTEGKIILERLALWKTSFRSETIANVRDRTAREKDTTSKDLKAMHDLVHSKVAFEKVQNPSDDNIDDNIDFLVTYIFLCLSYKNFQRPSPATNMTLKEANEAEFVSHGNEDDKLKIIVSKHETAKSYGPAILYLSQDDATMFVHYRDSIRPNIPTSSNCDLLLVKANGEPFTKNYSYFVQTYANWPTDIFFLSFSIFHWKISPLY